LAFGCQTNYISEQSLLSVRRITIDEQTKFHDYLIHLRSVKQRISIRVDVLKERKAVIRNWPELRKHVLLVIDVAQSFAFQCLENDVNGQWRPHLIA